MSAIARELSLNSFRYQSVIKGQLKQVFLLGDILRLLKQYNLSLYWYDQALLSRNNCKEALFGQGQQIVIRVGDSLKLITQIQFVRLLQYQVRFQQLEIKDKQQNFSVILGIYTVSGQKKLQKLIQIFNEQEFQKVCMFIDKQLYISLRSDLQFQQKSNTCISFDNHKIGE